MFDDAISELLVMVVCMAPAWRTIAESYYPILVVTRKQYFTTDGIGKQAGGFRYNHTTCPLQKL